jgi:hypothetical protein
MKGTVLRVIVALASVGAGVIHFLVTPDHFAEFVLFGVFFLLLGIFQVVWAGGAVLKPNALVLWTGVIASAVTIGIWLVSRTAGLPIGPEAGEPEPFGLLDVLASALEGLVVLGGIYLLTRPKAERTGEYEPATESERRAA